MDNENPHIIIFGIGPLSRTIFYSSQRSNSCRIACFTADRQYIKEATFCGLPVIAFEEIDQEYPPSDYDMLVVNVGAVSGTISRKDMFLRAGDRGYNFANYIDAKADVMPDLIMGRNNIIMSNTHVGPCGRMGDDNFIRENTYLGHDFIIGDHNFLGPGCSFGGSCRIGDLNFIGMGSTVINDIHIGSGNLIGAGTLVIRNLEDCGRYVGHPAKRVGDYLQTRTDTCRA